jgi:hypothetical protein
LTAALASGFEAFERAGAATIVSVDAPADTSPPILSDELIG